MADIFLNWYRHFSAIAKSVPGKCGHESYLRANKLGKAGLLLILEKECFSYKREDVNEKYYICYLLFSFFYWDVILFNLEKHLRR